MGELGEADYPDKVNIRGYKPNTAVHIGQLKRAIKMLGKAKTSIVLAGACDIAHANEDFTKLVNKTNIPVITTIMGKGQFQAITRCMWGISECMVPMPVIWP